MKMNLKKTVVIKQSVCWLAALVGLLMIPGILAYQQSERALGIVSRDKELTDVLRDAAEQNRIIHLLNKGKIDEAKKLINGEFAYNLSRVDGLAADATDNAKAFARVLKTEVAHDQHAHPTFYLASAKSAALNPAVAAQMGQH